MRISPWILTGILLFGFGLGCKKAGKKPEGPLIGLTRVKQAVMPQIFQGVESALERFRNENDRFPQRLVELVPTYLTSEEDLIDSWGSNLRLLPGATPGGVLLKSAGPDREFDTEDDLVRSMQ